MHSVASGILSGATQKPYAGRVSEMRHAEDEKRTTKTRTIGAVDAEGMTRLSALRFNVANVAKALASAVKVVKAGNLVVMHPDPEKCFIQNISTGERMKLREEKGTYVFDVVFEETKEAGQVTLDSGAGVSVWPRNKMKGVKLLPKQEGLRMVAANGTEIVNEGQKVIKFRGYEMESKGEADQTFGRPK